MSRLSDIGWIEAYLGEGTIVPEVALVGEAVADEAELALLGVLLDGVEGLLFADLWFFYQFCSRRQCVQGGGMVNAPPSSHWSSGGPRRSC